MSPEAIEGGPLAFVRTGDIVRLDAETGELSVRPASDRLEDREAAHPGPVQAWGFGRELFSGFRALVGTAEEGASVCFAADYGGGARKDHVDGNVNDRMVDA